MQDQQIEDSQSTYSITEERKRDEDAEIEHIIMESDEHTGNMYRMVNKPYYCYVCQLRLKKLISVSDFIENGLICDRCS